MKFLDQAKIYIRSGNGGTGAVSFRREKFLEFGGPDGGDGGRGGDVIVEASTSLNTLIDYRYQQHFSAKTGMHGMGRQRSGAKGADVILKVPIGTQIFAEDNETLLYDLIHPDDRFLLAKGGNGGFGNLHFTTSTNRAPRRANPGQTGEELTLWLRLKLVADAGLIGIPNAGKSTFLAAVTAAKPKIADYAFTTLHPNLGVARQDNRECVLIDVPGLIEGAHEGAGIGDRFLGHIERTHVLVHLVSAREDDPAKAYHLVRNALAHYGHHLTNKPEIVALSQCDLINPEEQQAKAALLEQARETTKENAVGNVILLSSAIHQGIDILLRQIFSVLDRNPNMKSQEFPDVS